MSRVLPQQHSGASATQPNPATNADREGQPVIPAGGAQAPPTKGARSPKIVVCKSAQPSCTGDGRLPPRHPRRSLRKSDQNPGQSIPEPASRDGPRGLNAPDQIPSTTIITAPPVHVPGEQAPGEDRSSGALPREALGP
ncbi:hypothetical protein VTO42DRAFT_455 [Malbranchea cinnamomea]